MTLSRWTSVLAVAVLAAYLVPEWVSFFASEVFVFSNGWDEPTYLSWQGIQGGRNELGMYSLQIYGLLHEAGLSGAIQNLLSDTVIPPLTVLLVALSFRLMGIVSWRAFAYAVLTLFSSTLFNYANPLFYNLPWAYDNSALLMTGMERYPSLLRTPNPQLSYFFIALALYSWMRWRWLWILLLPLPLLYYYVAVPYVFLIALGVVVPFGRKVLRSETQARLAAALFLYLGMGIGAVVLFTLAGYYDPGSYVANNQLLSSQTRLPQIPLALLILLAIAAWLGRMRWLSGDLRPRVALLVLSLAAIATVNLHVITGFMLSQKNYYDYGLSILFGLILVVLLEWLNERRRADLALAALLAVIVIPTLASHIHFYRVAAMASAKATLVIGDVRKDPLHAIIPDIETSSRLAYSTPKLLAPPYSYQYYFPFIEKQCSLFSALLDASMIQARRELTGRPEELDVVELVKANIRQGQKESKAIAYKNLPYCQVDAYRTDNFKVMTVKP